MKVNGRHYKTIWMESSAVMMIDQNKLPFEFVIFKSDNYHTTCKAIVEMTVRGAGAIGAAAGYTMAQAFMQNINPDEARATIMNTRPTARDLFYAVEKVYLAGKQSVGDALTMANELALENEEAGRRIGVTGNGLIKEKANILTHCNAGWLAFVDYGSALAPIYAAHASGKKIHVYVDETRPRGQGARLTAWELMNEGVPHTIIPDNAAALLMSRGVIDMVITGADRIAANGDTANKIGTLEKAILAKYYNIPFYVAAPSSTIDKNTLTGKDIIIEERSEKEVLWQTGPDKEGIKHSVLVANPGSHALNPAFDVTPAALITAIITEKGVVRSEG
ncbi:MAG TPA: S-methyl-5-thioribose-1-phosphate isomerase [Lentimicrobium sp.]|nr:S-methyl-5-thioribose-1-phosphate isomerase [Lentimicrobium sp.]